MNPRFTNVDAAGLDATIVRYSETLTVYPEVDDPRNFDAFHGRAEARYARGFPTRDVINDLRCAGICLKSTARVRFYKLEPHRLKTRRLDPMHLALLHADPELVEAMGSDYGLPLMTFYAGAGDPDLEAEVHLFSRYFRARRITGPGDVPGLAAMTYAAALGSLMRGDEAAAGAVLRVLSGAIDDLKTEPPESGKRYLMQCAALADLLGRRTDELASHLVALLPYTKKVESAAREAAGEAAVTEGRGAPDIVLPALTGLAALMNIDIDLAPLTERDPHHGALAAEVARAWQLVE